MRSILNEVVESVKDSLNKGLRVEAIKAKLMNNGASESLSDKIIQIAKIEMNQNQVA